MCAKSTAAVLPVTCVHDLGIYLDLDTSMKTHISKTTSCCFIALRQIRSIPRSVGKSILSFWHLDNGSTNLAGISCQLLDLERLQPVLNAAAWLVCDGRKYDHILPAVVLKMYTLEWTVLTGRQGLGFISLGPPTVIRCVCILFCYILYCILCVVLL